MEWSTLVDEDHEESPTAHGQSLQGKMEVWCIYLFCTRFLSFKDLVFLGLTLRQNYPGCQSFVFYVLCKSRGKQRQQGVTRVLKRWFSLAYIYKFSEQLSAYDNVI